MKTEYPTKSEIRKIVGKKIPDTIAVLMALYKLGAVDEKHAVTIEELNKEFDRIKKHR